MSALYFSFVPLAEEPFFFHYTAEEARARVLGAMRGLQPPFDVEELDICRGVVSEIGHIDKRDKDGSAITLKLENL